MTLNSTELVLIYFPQPWDLFWINQNVSHSEYLLVTCQKDNTPSPQVKDFQFGVSPVHYSVSEYLTKVRQRKNWVRKKD